MTDVANPPAGMPRLDANDLASLLQQSLDGDETAFAAVYDATVAQAYGLGLRVLHDPAVAAEVVREAYLHLWTHSARFEPSRGSALAWILMIVHRTAVSRSRSMAALVTDPIRVATRAGSACGALAKLAAPERRAVELAYCVGLTHIEVEQLTGSPVGTAQLRIRQGLLELRSVMIGR